MDSVCQVIIWSYYLLAGEREQGEKMFTRGTNLDSLSTPPSPNLQIKTPDP